MSEQPIDAPEVCSVCSKAEYTIRWGACLNCREEARTEDLLDIMKDERYDNWGKDISKR